MTDTIDKEINDILQREGGFVNNPDDKGGPTAFGISKKANPDAWVNGPPTIDQAREIYKRKYVFGPGFDKITDEKLQAQLVDYGVNSGPMIAIQKLQQIVGVKVDGVLGPKTLAAVAMFQPRDVSNHLAVLRVKMIGNIVSRNPSQLKFLNGWISRACEFIV
jgi:lysozyme family protein